MTKPYLPIEHLKQSTLSEPDAARLRAYEFIYVLSGSCQILLEDSSAEYGEDDLCLFSPGTVYQICPSRSVTLLRISISVPFMEQAMNGTGVFLCDSAKEPNNNYSVQKRYLLRIASKYTCGQDGGELEIMELLYGLLAVMKKENYLPMLPDKEIPDKYQSRVHEIIHYIDQHYHEQFSLSDLAEELYLTPAYLSKFFKKYLDTNFKDYLNQKRLFHACHDIRYTDDYFTDIAVRNGFSNITVFTKIFRSYFGVTPTEYRRKYHAAVIKNEIHETTQILCLEDTGSHKAAAEYEPDGLIITLKEKNGRNCHSGMTGLLNIGSIQNLLDHNFCEQLVKAQKAYPFRYVRMEGLIRSSFIPQLLPSHEYDFRKTDEVLNFLHRHGMIPFIELNRLPSSNTPEKDSLVPKALHRNHRYFNLLEKTLIHICDFYPRQWTQQWIFELGMSPHDTAGLYIQDFIKIRGLLNRLIPGALFGGYGYRISSGKDGFSSMLRLFRKNEITPDFLSVSVSLETPTENHILVNPDSSHIRTQVREAKKIIDRYFPGIPLYITE